MASPRNSSYKVALVGTSYVGKTTLFLRLAREEFVDTTIDSVICDTSTNETTSRTTFGFDYTTKDFEVDGGRQTITLHVYDTAGGERYKDVTQTYYQGSQAIILTFGVNDSYTFDSLQVLLNECRRSLGEDTVWILVANKIDLVREVLPEQIEHFCRTNFIQNTFYTSAKTGENVTEMFQEVAEVVHKVHGNKQAAKMPKQCKHTTTVPTPKRNNSCCCNIL